MTNKELLFSSIESINTFQKIEKLTYAEGSGVSFNGLPYRSIGIYYYGKLIFREDYIGNDEHVLYDLALSRIIGSGLYSIVNNVDLAHDATL